MKRRSLICIAASFLLCSAVELVSAQMDNSLPVPRQPLLGKVPDSGMWTAVFKYKEDSSTQNQPGKTAASKGPTGEHIVSTITEKQGSTYHQIANYASGAKRETWSLNGTQVCKPIYATSYTSVAGNHPFYVDFSTGGLGELSWIAMDNYVGVSGQNPKVFTFEVKNTVRQPTAAEKDEYSLVEKGFEIPVDDKTGHTPVTKSSPKDRLEQYLRQKFGDTKSRVDLDANSQLPIIYDDGFEVRTYSFSALPRSLSVPPEVTQLIQYCANLTKTTVVRPSPP